MDLISIIAKDATFRIHCPPAPPEAPGPPNRATLRGRFAELIAILSLSRGMPAFVRISIWRDTPRMFYLDLFRVLQEERVDYVVVGGLAINLHGVERATMDVDLVLAMDDPNVQRFLAAATRLQLKPSMPVPLEALRDAKQLDKWITEKRLIAFSLQAASPNLPTVDILVRPTLPFDAIYRNRIEKDIGGIRFNLASIDDLIALKTGTGRKQDASDIDALRMVARVSGKER